MTKGPTIHIHMATNNTFAKQGRRDIHKTKQKNNKHTTTQPNLTSPRLLMIRAFRMTNASTTNLHKYKRKCQQPRKQQTSKLTIHCPREKLK